MCSDEMLKPFALVIEEASVEQLPLSIYRSLSIPHKPEQNDCIMSFSWDDRRST